MDTQMYNEYMTWNQYYQLQEQINFYNQYNNWVEQCHSEFIPEKLCTKCNMFKSYSEFYFRKDNQKYRNECKECLAQYKKQKYLSNPEVKQYYLNYGKTWRDNNKEHIQNYQQAHRNELKEYNKQYQKQRYETDLNYRNKRKEYNRNQYHSDLNYKIRKILSGRIKNVLNGISKSNNTQQLLGCSLEFFKDFVEFSFYDNMCWDNYGSHWHIDHVRPCASFDLSDPGQQRECFNWRNLSPLRADKNMSKKDKIDNFQILMQELRVTMFLKINNVLLC